MTKQENTALELLKILIVCLLFFWLLSMMGCTTRAERHAALLLQEKQRHEGNYADTNTLLIWLSSMSIIGLGGCAVAAILLPIKKLWGALAVGFACVLSVSLTVKAALPYMQWVALGVGLVSVAAAIWYFRKYVIATRAAVCFGEAMTDANSEAEAMIVKSKHAVEQAKLGVKTLIDNTITKIKEKSA